MVMASGVPYTNHRSRHITRPVPHHSVFLEAGCPSCHSTNSIKALKAKVHLKKMAVEEEIL